MNLQVLAGAARKFGPRDLLLGAHASDFDLLGAGTTPSSVALNTQTQDSTLIVPTFGEFVQYNTPTDNKGNTLTLLKSSGYNGGAYPGFGMRVYGAANAAGGSSHNVQFTKASGHASDESTLVALEVKGGRVIQDSSIVTRAGAGAGVAYASASVTTTGPAILVTAWGGDGNEFTTDQTAAVQSGWEMVESLFLGLTSYIQAAVAFKYVSGPGTYTVQWTPVANQGGIIALVAVQG